MLSIRPICARVLLVPAFLAAFLGASSPAQERNPASLPPSVDVKTAPEPLSPAQVAPARPAAPRATVEPPKSSNRAGPGANLHIDHSRMHYQEPGDGVIWARGQDYRVSFDAAGATYYPVLGRRQPHDVPHVLSPDLVTLGGEPLSFERVAAAVRDGDHVAIDRGTFTENYALTPQSMEQTFVFSSLPSAGDLVVRLPVASELEPAECDGGIEFRGELGRVTYGRATAIDARGRRTAAATVLENGAITIRVDSGFLAAASMPLVIDPVVVTFPVDTTGPDNYWADCAYDAASHHWLVVFEEWVSASNRDAYTAILNDSGAVLVSFYLDLSNNAWDSVHCANNAAAQQFLVVASVTSGLQLYVLGLTIYASGSIGTQTVITGTEAGSIRNCVVGGDPYVGGAGPSYYCVVYERMYSATDWDILARLVAPDGSLVGTGPIYLSNSGGTIDVGPAVSKSDAAHDWMVVWQRNNGVLNDADVWGGILHWDGTVFAAPFQISAWVQAEWQVAVSSPLNGSMRYLATWQVTDAGDHDIIMALLDGTTKLDQQDLSIQEQYNYTLDQVEPSVDSDGDHFFVAYSEQFSGADYDIYGSDVFVAGTTLGLAQRHAGIDLSTSADHTPRLASAFSGGATDPARKHRYLCAWNSAPNGGGANDVFGALLDTLAGGSTSPFCFGDGSGSACPCANTGASGHGCANSVNAMGALLSASGTPSTVGDTLALNLAGVPPTAPCTFFQGTANGNVVFGDGLRCTSGTLVRLKTVTAAAGVASYPGVGDPSVSVRGIVPVDGGFRTYQASYRNSATFCTSATFNISNGLIVNWAR